MGGTLWKAVSAKAKGGGCSEGTICHERDKIVREAGSATAK